MRLLLKVTTFTIGILLVLPTIALAYSVQSLGPSITASTDQNLYRLRAAGKPWQLSALTADQLSSQPIEINNQLVLTAKTGGLTQVISSNGLGYQPLPGLSGENINLVKRDQMIFVGLQNGSTISTAVIKNDLSITPLPGLLLASIDQTDHLFSFNGEIYYGEQFNQLIRILHFHTGNWSSVASFPCGASQFSAQPLIGFSCQEGQYYYPVNEGEWQPLFPTTIQSLTSGDRLLAAGDAQNNLYIWRSNTLNTYSLQLAGRNITSLKVVADRLFLLLSDDSWWEFNFADHTLLPLPNNSEQLTASTDINRIFLKSGVDYYVSDNPGVWMKITTEGSFSLLQKVAGGWLAWQIDSSLVQYAADNSTVFTKVTNSWAASSKIKAVFSQDNLGVILLLNASNNPNLYQSSDFRSWSRVTLPSAPTFVLPISQIRLLPAGSLAEASGIISVPAGAVSGEIIYLQDPTGGIQIFLDSSKGVLPTLTNKLASATGTLSTSQTKRLVLSTLDDLIIGSNQTLVLNELGVDELVNHLGIAAVTQASINTEGSGYYNLNLANGTLKFHYPTSLLNFLKGSTVKLPLITDYNSSSGSVESWYLGSGASLVSSPIPEKVPVSSAIKTTTGSKATSSKSKSTAVSGSANSSHSVSRQEPVTQKATPTIVSGAQENDTVQTVILAIASFIAGALVMRGSRLSALVNGS